MSKIKEVLRLKYLNLLSNRQIKTIRGVSRNSIANYANSFNKMNLSLDHTLKLEDEEVEQLFHPKEPLVSKISTTVVEIDWNNIHQELFSVPMAFAEPVKFLTAKNYIISDTHTVVV